MFAPVVCRFLSCGGPGRSEASRAYMAAVRAYPLMREWYSQAAREPQDWQLDMYESLP